VPESVYRVVLLALAVCGVSTIALALSTTGRREGASFWFSCAVTFASLGWVQVSRSGSLDSPLEWTVAGLTAATSVAALVRGTIALRRRDTRVDRKVQ